MNWVWIFIGFTLLIVLHEAGHFFAAKATGMRVERFFLFFPPKLVSIKRGETEYGIGAIPAGGFVKITGMNPDEELPPEIAARGYYAQPVWKRIVVIGAGPAVNIVLAFVILFSILAFNGVEETNQTVGAIDHGAPAANLLRRGDVIVAIDGNSYPHLDRQARLKQFVNDVGSHKCAGRQVEGCKAATPAVLRVRRGDSVSTVRVWPKYDDAVKRSRLGISYGTTFVDVSLGEAVDRSTGFMWEVTKGTVSVFTNLFDSEKRKEVSGVVGVSDVANQTINEFGFERALVLLALVSLSLGLINLFPFLPLDGGHIFWSLVEKARGKPVPFRVMERAGVLGFVLVIMLFFLGLSNDIGRLTGEGFNVH